MRILSVYVPILIALFASQLCAAEIHQTNNSPYSSPKFLTHRQPFPHELKPFIINETPGIHGNITLALTLKQYEQYQHLVDPITHISIILRLE